MRLLLDTHIWLWSLIEPARLGAQLRKALRDPKNELWLSPVSVWEAIMLGERRRVEMGGDPAQWVRGALREIAIRDAPLTREVAITSRAVNLPHQDPADRFIAASAIVHELTLATADDRLLAANGLATLANR